MASSASEHDSNHRTASLNSQSSSFSWSNEFENHRGWLRKVLRCRINDQAAVEDYLQEIAVAVVKQDNKPVEFEKVPAWLYRLAIRQAVNHHRRAGRQKNLLCGFQTYCDMTVCDEIEPLDWLVHCEQQDAVREGLKLLKPGDREILMLKYTENWSYKQLANHMGVSTTTVEYRLIRAKKRMRQAISGLVSSKVNS